MCYHTTPIYSAIHWWHWCKCFNRRAKVKWWDALAVHHLVKSTAGRCLTISGSILVLWQVFHLEHCVIYCNIWHWCKCFNRRAKVKWWDALAVHQPSALLCVVTIYERSLLMLFIVAQSVIYCTYVHNINTYVHIFSHRQTYTHFYTIYTISHLHMTGSQ